MIGLTYTITPKTKTTPKTISTLSCGIKWACIKISNYILYQSAICI
jgi:hypothetical protein